MKWIRLLLLLLLHATFNTSTTAVVSWQQPANVRYTCLLRYHGAAWPAGICWENLPAGPMRVDLPGKLTHPAFRPAEGDRYELRFENEVVGGAVLGQTIVHTTYLPLAVRQVLEPLYRVRLAAVRA